MKDENNIYSSTTQNYKLYLTTIRSGNVESFYLHTYVDLGR